MSMTKFLESNGFTVILLVALIVASILALNYAFQPTMDRVVWAETTYQVGAGESLWTIASNYCPDGVDRREWIAEVRALNNLHDSVIHPGQDLTVLVAVEED